LSVGLRRFGRGFDEEEGFNICGKTIQIDRSGVGQCWEAADEIDCPADISEEIAAEILDGGKKTCQKYLATNGINYRW
jgi:hypothetical protein